MRKTLTLFILSLALLSCVPKYSAEEHSEQSEKEVAKWPNVVMYEIFVQSFADADGDSIGDIQGMMNKLDYLQDLGIKGVWLMPIMPSPSYHKYDVTDYRDIHPDYGNTNVFKKFIQEAHNRDIKVVIDMIINHSSNQHPWFSDAVAGEDAEFRDYYVWATDEEIQKNSAFEKEATGDSGNLTQWHTTEGNTKKYYGFFTGMMPDLNYDNPEVRKEVIEIGRYWLEEIGVDGFRLDAAKHIYEDSRVMDNQNWWKEYRGKLEKIKSDNYLVGEVWDNTEFVAPFLHGLPALFNFDLAFSMLESIKREKSVTAVIAGHSWKVDESMSLEEGYVKNQAIYQKETPDYYDAIFLTNHDQNRVLSVLGGDVGKGKLAASLLLTMPGTPYIYYGEEIGMLGMKPDPNIREPFLWSEANYDSMRTKWIEPKFTIDETVVPLSEQIDDKNSIYHHYKSLIGIRNHSEALSFGDFRPADYDKETTISYYRSSGNEDLLVIHNLSNRSLAIQLKGVDEAFRKTLLSTNGGVANNGKFDLQAYSSIILKKTR